MVNRTSGKTSLLYSIAQFPVNVLSSPRYPEAACIVIKTSSYNLLFSKDGNITGWRKACPPQGRYQF